MLRESNCLQWPTSCWETRYLHWKMCWGHHDLSLVLWQACAPWSYFASLSPSSVSILCPRVIFLKSISNHTLLQLSTLQWHFAAGKVKYNCIKGPQSGIEDSQRSVAPELLFQNFPHIESFSESPGPTVNLNSLFCEFLCLEFTM